MNLSSSDLQHLCQLAIAAAQHAGQIISQHTGTTVPINNKTDGGATLASQIVTKVDYLSQESILRTLLPTCDSYNLSLLTEEKPDDLSRLTNDFFWCIDPLDGTLPFTESTSGYAVSIALVSRDGIPYIGVIYDPVKQTLYHAIKDEGACKNNRPYLLQSKPLGESLTFITDRSFKQQPFFSAVIDELTIIAKQMGCSGLNTITHGGAVMNACWVLEKPIACYFKFPKSQKGGGSLWDYAATACIFQESGGFVGDIFGNSIDLNRTDSTFLNHRGVLYCNNHALTEKIKMLYLKLKNQLE